MNHSLRKLILAIVLISITYTLFSQVSQRITLASNTFYHAGAASVNNVNLATLPNLNFDSIRAKADSTSLKTGMAYFGKIFPCDIDLTQQGTHEIMDIGDLYRLRLAVPGASGMQVYFDQFNLSQGSYVWLYNPSETQVLGAFTAQNNKTNNKLATSIIIGDTIVIEYFVPLDSSVSSNTINPLHFNYFVAEFYNIFTGDTSSYVKNYSHDSITADSNYHHAVHHSAPHSYNPFANLFSLGEDNSNNGDTYRNSGNTDGNSGITDANSEITDANSGNTDAMIYFKV